MDFGGFFFPGFEGIETSKKRYPKRLGLCEVMLAIRETSKKLGISKKNQGLTPKYTPED